MMKSIIKEIFIIILLMIAIALILGILLYEYVPTNKKVPSKVSGYVLPEEMTQELQETIETAEKQNIIQTYKVDGADLDYAEKYTGYDKGKTDPFAPINTSSSVENGNNNENSNSNENSNTKDENNKTQEDSPNNSNQGQFFNEVK